MRNTPQQHDNILSRMRSVIGASVIISICFLAACNTAQITPAPSTATSGATSMECIPVEGSVSPMTCIASIDVQINDASPQPAKYDEQISLQAGDVLRLVGMEYCASEQKSADSVAGEAYLFADSIENYDDGRFTKGSPKVRAGCGIAGDFKGSWTMEQGEHRIAIVLVHYYGDTQEIDDRFYINLSVEP